MVIAELFCTSSILANLIVAKELISLYIDQDEVKYFEVSEVVPYFGIIAGGFFLWSVMSQLLNFYGQLIGVQMKKIFNGLMHNKLLKLSQRSLAS